MHYLLFSKKKEKKIVKFLLVEWFLIYRLKKYDTHLIIVLLGGYNKTRTRVLPFTVFTTFPASFPGWSLIIACLL